MSGYDLGQVTLARGGAATELGPLYDAAVNSAWYVENFLARDAALEKAYDTRIDAVKAATGIDLANPIRVKPSDWDESAPDPHDEFARRLHELEAQKPELAGVIKAGRPVIEDARAIRNESEGRLDDLSSRWRGMWGGATLARAAGSFRGGLSDPVNAGITLATLPFGGGASLIRGALVSGAANAGGELVQQPWVQAWRAEAGIEPALASGFSHAAMNVASAGVAGFGLDAVLRGAGRSIKLGADRARGVETSSFVDAVLHGKKPAPRPADGAPAGADGQPPPEAPAAAPAARTPPEAPETALEAAAARRPPGDPLHDAIAAGDPKALEKLARDAGLEADDAVRGALASIEADRALKLDKPPKGTAASDHADALVQAGRAAEGREPPIADPAPVPKAPAGPELSDLAPPPADAFTVDRKPVTFTNFDPRKLEADPNAFQYKGGGDAEGVTGRLNGVTRWDELASGKVFVYERADGTMVIADGHQRRGLAKRLLDEGLAQGVELKGYRFREADGWQPGDVRALAAKKNLQEGSGTTLDAARIIRDRPDIIDTSVPVTGPFMREARNLAKLSDEAFSLAWNGRLPENQAAVVGELVRDKARHLGVIDELIRADLAGPRQARLFVAQAAELPAHVETQLDMLGAHTVARSLMAERTQVLDAALSGLAADRRLFATLDREAGLIERAGNRLAKDANARLAQEAAMTRQIVESLAITRGPVSDALTAAAEALAEGASKKKVAAEFARKVSEMIDEKGLAGLQRDMAAVGRGLDDPHGPAAKAQLESLKLEAEGLKLEPKSEGQQSLFDMFATEKEAAKRFGDLLEMAEACKA